MKLFVNDWDPERFVLNAEENREYPINAWIPTVADKSVYLVSAYVYNEFVMFFYMCELKNDNSAGIHFDYEVNYLKAGSGRCGECRPCEYKPDPEVERDEYMESYFGEYDYLLSLMRDTGRIPEELKDKELTFKKDCYSFEKPVDEIEHIGIYPPRYDAKRHYVDKTFDVPYGECDITVPYVFPDTREESYIIIRELKIQDMLEAFDENYSKFQEAREKTLREHGDIGVMSLEEVRQFYDMRVLTLSFLKPEEKRSFEFELLNKPVSTGGSHVAVMFLFHQDQDDKMERDLYKHMAGLCKIDEEPRKEYQIRLVSVTDTAENERKAVYTYTEINFQKR